MNPLRLILDETTGQLLRDFSGVPAKLSDYQPFTHLDEFPIELMPVRSVDGGYVPADWSSDTVKCALAAETGPQTGGFTLTYDSVESDTSYLIGPGVALEEIEDTLNSTSSIADDGGVWVKPALGGEPIPRQTWAFEIHFKTVGAKNGPFTLNDYSLYPLSAGRIQVLQAGTASVHEIVRVEVVLKNLIEATFSGGSSTAVTVTTDAAGDASTEEVQSVVLDPPAISGLAHWTVGALTGWLPVDSTAEDLNRVFSREATFFDRGHQRWQAVFSECGDKSPIAVGADALTTPDVLSATLDLDSVRLDAFMTDRPLRCLFQIHHEEAGGQKNTRYSEAITLQIDRIRTETAP
jgi:hypothetical protein